MTVASIPIWSAETRPQGDLNTGTGDLGDLGRETGHAFGTDAERGAAGEHLAAELEQDALVLGHGKEAGRPVYSTGGAVTVGRQLSTTATKP